MAQYLLPFLYLISSALATYFLLKLSIPIFKKILPAYPTSRGMHNMTKPTSGGILFALVYSLFALFKGFHLALLSMPIAIIGLIDDKYNISRKTRYLAQIINLILIIIYLSVNNVGIFQNSFNYNFWHYFFLVFFGTAIINFINFIDGIDGLLSGSMIIILLIMNTQFPFLSAFIGALLAFLIFNWSPSKIFMGDSGSLYLGAFFVSLVYSSPEYISLIKLILLSSPLLFDSLICIIRRFLNKQNIFKSHKLHLYQRLVSNGMSHSQVSMIYMSSISFLGLIYIFCTLKYLIIASSLVIILGIFLDKNYALDFNF